MRNLSLEGHKVLIAEDEPITAFDLMLAVQAANGEVLGPFSTVAAGLAAYRAAELLHGAILDVELADAHVTPLAHELLGRGVKVVFHSGSDIPQEIFDRHGPVPHCKKPMVSDEVVARLAHHCAQSRSRSH